jgi:hypothetical protein
LSRERRKGRGADFGPRVGKPGSFSLICSRSLLMGSTLSVSVIMRTTSIRDSSLNLPPPPKVSPSDVSQNPAPFIANLLERSDSLHPDWIVESIVNRKTEHFPTGAMAYLKQACAWARDAGLNVIIDLHVRGRGCSGSNSNPSRFSASICREHRVPRRLVTLSLVNTFPRKPSGRHDARSRADVSCHRVWPERPGFYGSNAGFQRAYAWAQNLTKLIHTDDSFSTVFALEVLNEPVQSTMDGERFPASRDRFVRG